MRSTSPFQSESLFAEAYRRLREDRDSRLHYLSRIFEDDDRPLNVGAFYLRDEGNRRVAAAMMPTLVQSLQPGIAAR